MTANVKFTIEQWSQIFYETHVAYRLAVIHSACSSSLQSGLWIAHANTPTTLSLFNNVIFRHGDVIQKNISFIETNQINVCTDLHFTHSNLMSKNPPND